VQKLPEALEIRRALQADEPIVPDVRKREQAGAEPQAAGEVADAVPGLRKTDD
jgi:hypothetical protein